jgi:hypothetical protein
VTSYDSRNTLRKKEFESKFIFKGPLFSEHLTFKAHHPLPLDSQSWPQGCRQRRRIWRDRETQEAKANGREEQLGLGDVKVRRRAGESGGWIKRKRMSNDICSNRMLEKVRKIGHQAVRPTVGEEGKCLKWPLCSFNLLIYFLDGLSLWSWGWPWTHDPPASASQVLELKVYVTMPGSCNFFFPRWAGLGFEFRALCLQSRHSTTWPHLQSILLCCFEDGVSRTVCPG